MAEANLSDDENELNDPSVEARTVDDDTAVADAEGKFLFVHMQFLVFKECTASASFVVWANSVLDEKWCKLVVWQAR